MTPEESSLMHGHADTCRRHAILEAVVGVALLGMSVICAARGEAWQGAFVGIAAGGFLVAAGFTAVQGMRWDRVASTRDRNVSKEGE